MNTKALVCSGVILLVAVTLFAGQVPPMETTSPTAAQTKVGGEPVVRRAFSATIRELGIVVEEVPGLVSYHLPLLRPGAMISNIDPQGAASKVGLRAGDVIVAVNHRLLQSPHELQEALATSRQSVLRILAYQAGHPIEVTVQGTAAVAVIAPVQVPATGLRTNVQAFNMNLPQGSLSVTGTNGQYKLEARIPDSTGRVKLIQQAGTIQQMREITDQLPEPLRTLAKERLK